MLSLELIRIDGDTQARVQLDQATVDEYADAFLSGVEFPPVTVFFDGAERWLADGFHRYFAAKKAGKKKILEHVIPGTKRDAILYSLTANATHGLKRTNADKRKAVETLLKDAEWSQWSDSQIAKQCLVDHKTVAARRAEHLGNSQDAPAVRKVERAGKTYEQDTSNIGKAKVPDEVQNGVKNIPETIPATEEHYDPRDDHLKETQQALAEVAAENEELRDRLATGVMEGTEEEKQEAAQIIADLRQQVKTLEAENAALKSSRDHFQREASELRKQIKMNERELKKARALA